LARPPRPGGPSGQVSAGDYHTCGLRTDGTLACWGDNGFGQATPPAGTFTQVSAGDYHTCGLRTDGTLDCWGWSYYNQAAPPAGTFTQVASGACHTCGLQTDGTLACWGSTAGAISLRHPASSARSVLAGYTTAGCEAMVYWICWGFNGYGQLYGYRVTLPLASRAY